MVNLSKGGWREPPLVVIVSLLGESLFADWVGVIPDPKKFTVRGPAKILIGVLSVKPF